jgi:catechol 2,3-dioxygenase-like lactoylglutathione lyase family enzyme
VVGAAVTRPARRPTGPRGLRHIALRSRDLRATERFYVDVLGLRVAFPHRGMLFLESPGGGDLLNFVATRRAFDADAGGFDHLGLRVPSAEWRATMARLARAGARIAGRRGRDAVYMKDPNGYTVELYRD